MEEVDELLQQVAVGVNREDQMVLWLIVRGIKEAWEVHVLVVQWVIAVYFHWQRAEFSDPLLI